MPDWFFLYPGPLVPLANSTAEAYVTDLEACRRRVEWCDANRIEHAADHLLALIDRQQGVAQYWPQDAMVEQGSVVGLFDSVLDASRMKHSPHLQRRAPTAGPGGAGAPGASAGSGRCTP